MSDEAAKPARWGRPFPPGQSGNPGGRSKAAGQMARLIREQTRDGAELVEFALAVLRGGEVPGQPAEPTAPQDVPDDPKSRMFALQWLSDRGFGKAMQDVDVLLGVVEITPEQQAMIDALRLSPHERRERIAELRARAAVPAALATGAGGDDDAE